MTRLRTSGRLHPVDVIRVGAAGLRTRPLRVTLAAAGIAIGIGSMIGVIGISASGRADLDRALDRLGTNLLTVSPGTTATGEAARLPVTSVPAVGRIGPVTSVSAVGRVDARVYRNDRMPIGQTGGIEVLAARLDLLDSVGAGVGRGAWLNPATARYPGVVLGATAAQRLGTGLPGTRLWLGGTWFSLTGVLDPVPLVPELDSAAIVGWPAAERYLGFDGHPTSLFVRSTEAQVEPVRAVLAATANPEAPSEVRVSRPSDALTARRAADRNLGALLLGLGAVALLVGGIGVANTMVISVLERRPEIGLRRALGATRGQIRTQFMIESLVLSGLGGIGGCALGSTVTAVYSATRGWPAVIPLAAVAAGVAATLVIGSLAGLYPAIRAARQSPTEALVAPH